MKRDYLNFLTKEKQRKVKRGIGYYYLSYCNIHLFIFNFVFPQLVSSIVGLANDIPTYISNTSLVNEFNSMKFKKNTTNYWQTMGKI